MLDGYINFGAMKANENARELYFFRSLELYIFLESAYENAPARTSALENAFTSICRNIWLQSRDEVSKYCPGMLSASFWHIAGTSKITWNENKQELGIN